MSLKKFLLRFLLTLMVTLAINGGFYWLSVLNGWWDPGFTPARYVRPMNGFPVLVNTLQAVIIGSLMFRMLTYYVSNGYLYFYFLSAVVFVLMFFAPFNIEGLPASMLACLETLHVTTALPLLFILPRGLKRED